MGQEGFMRIIDGKPCVSTSLVAYAFNVSKQTVAVWGKKGCPKVQQGYWYLPDVIQWRTDGSTDTGDEEANPSLKKTRWEAELKKQQALHRKFENDVSQKRYLKTEEVSEQLTSFFVAFKQAALGLPSKIASISEKLFDDKEKAQELELEAIEVITDALRQWSNGKLSELDFKPNEDTEAAGSADSE